MCPGRAADNLTLFFFVRSFCRDLRTVFWFRVRPRVPVVVQRRACVWQLVLVVLRLAHAGSGRSRSGALSVTARHPNSHAQIGGDPWRRQERRVPGPNRAFDGRAVATVERRVSLPLSPDSLVLALACLRFFGFVSHWMLTWCSSHLSSLESVRCASNTALCDSTVLLHIHTQASSARC